MTLPERELHGLLELLGEAHHADSVVREELPGSLEELEAVVDDQTRAHAIPRRRSCGCRPSRFDVEQTIDVNNQQQLIVEPMNSV